MPIVAAAGLAFALSAGSALAWDLHDTLAPGATPQTADTPPPGPVHEAPSGADLQLPNIDLAIPEISPSVGPPVSDSRCKDAMAKSGENSAEAWTQC